VPTTQGRRGVLGPGGVGGERRRQDRPLPSWPSQPVLMPPPSTVPPGPSVDTPTRPLIDTCKPANAAPGAETLTWAVGCTPAAGMGNVLSAEKRQQVIALGRLGWSLRRIEEATGVRRETASTYLRASGVVVRRPGRWGQLPKPAIEVSTDSDAVPAANPANGAGVSTDSAAAPPLPRPGRSPAASACEPYRELI